MKRTKSYNRQIVVITDGLHVTVSFRLSGVGGSQMLQNNLNDFLYSASLLMHRLPYYHIHHQSGPPVVDDEPSLTHHYIPKVTVYMSIHY